MATLIFIDTNILLDFYRVRGKQGDLSILNRIDQNHDRLITTSQVEMEFKKNRPFVLLESYQQLKKPDWTTLSLPAYLARSKQSSGLDTGRARIEEQLSALRDRLERSFRDATRNDRVYQVAQRLFRNDGPYNLTRDNDLRRTVRRAAWRRFILGYPPRKPRDTAIGDAINWEWIILCAQQAGRDVVIVSRDSDYGISFGKKLYLNDWLRQEFKDRVSRRRSITLTDRLADAFKQAEVDITPEEEATEQALLDSRRRDVSGVGLSPNTLAQLVLLQEQLQNLGMGFGPLAEALRIRMPRLPGLFGDVLAEGMIEGPEDDNSQGDGRDGGEA